MVAPPSPEKEDETAIIEEKRPAASASLMQSGRQALNGNDARDKVASREKMPRETVGRENANRENLATRGNAVFQQPHRAERRPLQTRLPDRDRRRHEDVAAKALSTTTIPADAKNVLPSILTRRNTIMVNNHPYIC